MINSINSDIHYKKKRINSNFKIDSCRFFRREIGAAKIPHNKKKDSTLTYTIKGGNGICSMQQLALTVQIHATYSIFEQITVIVLELVFNERSAATMGLILNK